MDGALWRWPGCCVMHRPSLVSPFTTFSTFSTWSRVSLVESRRQSQDTTTTNAPGHIARGLSMIDLGYENVLLASILTDKFANPTPIEQLISEFDGVTLRIVTPDPKQPHLLQLSMAMTCFDVLAGYGALDVMEREYPGLKTETEPGYDYTLLLDLQQLPEDPDARQSLINKLALIKRNALAAPFERAFSQHEQLAAQNSETSISEDMMVIQYREEEAIFIQASNDRVTVIFSTVFREETDRVFAKVFLQEFYDARRRPAVQNAPQVLFTIRDPPLEIRNQKGLKLNDNMGYVTFVLFPRHFTGHRKDACISHIQMFRNTLHFHIKASKAYMHQRMRARVSEFLKILNRAKPEQVERERKTAAGKRFTQR
ncbi:Arp2/3 complex, 34 kd subunit p34-Arc-domain-containing protein [Protomyces lactucae-debilis]|uniref:Arp2/3 complex 34 kDa subunit n=1 Tax=Protomyces lactucae-debilis TaxID=2754530 RepID=A0A1Y2FPU7_PROLT|nr:Arp2/3 complex, 34 kd subunit p34-Arc-domain-containing protein [Protomyces lactucae-debilis]ORY85627.1 Arp2/3 complex, 34 kd subunit p34-Arc-domain-containing protein [Protomyces lactucae-debilis]